MSARLDPERWARVERVFQEAITLRGEARATFLEEACGEEPELREEVESLLRHAGGGLTERVEAIGRVAGEALDDAAPVVVGRRLGPYRLERELGRGGMGIVYLGLRAEGDFEQQVAVKVLPGALYDPSAVRRFSNERRILAGLEHPNIARLLNGGATADGVPYVIMEYVDGEPVDRYCDTRELDLEARIRLFLAICDAVDYAHRSLVVHRDLKPGNVLVTEDGIPKLLDFGIAKLATPEDDEESPGTVTRVMTPRFASPEQLRGERIGTSTDVYSIGLILYRLLTSRLPWPDDASASDLARLVLEELPTPPSAASGDARLRGDLDTIVLKALRIQPDERYGSVRELANDLQRHMEGLPIRARAPTWRYRAGKFVRRNRVLVGVASALIASVLGFGAVMAIQARQLARERDAAEAAQLTAERTSEFLVELFREVDPAQSRGEQLTARDLLVRGAETARADLASEPVVLASVLDMIGRVYRTNAVYDTAFALLDEARQIRLELLGPEHEDYVSSLLNLGFLLRLRDDYEGAIAYYEDALGGYRALHGELHPDVALTLSNLGVAEAELGREDSAERRYRESIRIWDALDTDDPNALLPHNNLATILYTRGVYDSAIVIAEDLLARRRRIFEGDHPDIAVNLNNLGYFYMSAGRYSEAVPHFEESLAMRTRLYGYDHPSTLNARLAMGRIQYEQGRYELALDYYDALIVPSRAAGQPRLHAERVLWLARTRAALQRWSEAAVAAREALETATTAWGADHAIAVEALEILTRAEQALPSS